MADEVRVKVELQTPVKFGSETISELNFRRPKAKDLRKLVLTEEMELGVILDIARKLAGVEQQVIDDLDVKDVMKVAEVVGGFF